MKALKKIYAMLAAVTVELPYETEEERKKSEETNKQIAGLGFRTFRAADDWGYRRYEDTITALKAKGADPKDVQRKQPETFRSGDLVTIFKTVSDGDVQWQGTVDLDRSAYHHGLQRGMPPSDWSAMFHDQLPARLERDAKVIYGSLEPFFETGTEGVIWAVHEYGKPGYEGLHYLKDGDKLTAYSCVRDGEVEWQGRLDFGPEKAEKLGWSEILRQTKHVPTKKWQEWSWQNRPVAITPR